MHDLMRKFTWVMLSGCEVLRTVAVAQVALSELYSSAPSPAVPQLAAPPFDMAPPSSASMPQPNGLDRMRLSEETAGRDTSREADNMQCDHVEFPRSQGSVSLCAAISLCQAADIHLQACLEEILSQPC